MKKTILIGLTCMAMSSFVAAGTWMTDFDEAREKARTHNKPLLLLFTGSDWCGWCIKLEKAVFSKREFKKYADRALICVKADFPRRKKIPATVKKQNKALRTKYKIKGFPTVLLLNPADEKVIARTGYKKGGAGDYVKHLEQLTRDFRQKNGPPAPAENPYEKSRVWQDSQGRKLTGKLVEFKDGEVVIQTLTGNSVKTAVNNLSEKDQKLLQSLPDNYKDLNP